MIRCGICGRKNADGDAFCVVCGSPLAASDRPIRSKAIEHLWENARSPLFLWAVILTTATLVCGGVANVLAPATLSETVRAYARQAGIQQQPMMNAVFALSQWLGLLPTAINAVGLWLIVLSARRAQKPLSIAGLTICQVIQTVNLVTFILAFLGAVISVTAIVGGAGDPDVVGAWAGMLTGTMGTWIPAIIIAVLAIRSIRAAKSVLTTGAATDKIPGAFPVICFILGGLTGFAVLLSLPAADAAGWVGLARSAISAAVHILFGLVLVRVRGERGPALGRERH